MSAPNFLASLVCSLQIARFSMTEVRASIRLQTKKKCVFYKSECHFLDFLLKIRMQMIVIELELSLQKLGAILENKVLQKRKLFKKSQNEVCSLDLVFCITQKSNLVVRSSSSIKRLFVEFTFFIAYSCSFDWLMFVNCSYEMFFISSNFICL